MIILRQPTAEVGIVVAPDDEQQNTLKRFVGFDEKGRAILEYMNEDVCFRRQKEALLLFHNPNNTQACQINNLIRKQYDF